MKKKLLSFIFLLAALIAGLVLSHFFETLWFWFKLPKFSDWVIAPHDLLGILCGLIAFIVLMKHQKVNIFLSEVIQELEKITWPNRKETILSTGIVSILVGIAALILFAFDALWGTVVNFFYH
ncbi:MAG: preprotein translocase subunit SecE [Deltaproteobacteria bacterium RIFCSPLOWO2_02_FULL_44_10]|nr:MAG: preprotein translocase subunit SecE [Deltaproteobacteria bacterium RIFCSPHIGHO2_02_FULL_44_16]OGQ45111.1 MAG: preprotein translocase subunit SecE [Deltaproteobacteria bacterium RIFCSPLOWO2_02_FULL_44_10]